ncbi:hypothetical protein RvY_08745 [Ramazzottius varieornatus]|uniref:Uncharacterized protein n=1 Tax=Ramazzottius varieornatus TaxID=947166 RepID=A0A1D1V705_RAMVA|nr:hypothetical protein RvY_08745 [Ramazzottius varieornatus]
MIIQKSGKNSDHISMNRVVAETFRTKKGDFDGIDSTVKLQLDAVQCKNIIFRSLALFIGNYTGLSFKPRKKATTDIIVQKGEESCLTAVLKYVKCSKQRKPSSSFPTSKKSRGRCDGGKRDEGK